MPDTSIAFFTNPLSHTVKKHGSVLAKSALNLDVLRFDLDEFAAVNDQVKTTAQKGVSIIGIEGGDGTIQGVLTAVLSQSSLFKSKPKIVLLPGGMTNVIAANIGIKKPNVRKINSIVSNPNAANSKSLPLLKIDASNVEQNHYGFLLSTGALPTATIYCLDKIHTKGIGGATAVGTTLLTALMGRRAEREKIFTPTPLKLDTNTIHYTGDHLTSLATTLPKLMIGINPFWGEEQAPVRLTYAGPDIRHKFLNVARMFKKSQTGRSRQALKAGGFESWNIETATLEHHGPLILDGEILPDISGKLILSASEPLDFLS